LEIGSLKFQRVIIINATKTRYLTAKWSRTKMRRNIRQLVIIPAAWYGARTSSHAEIGTVCIFFSHCIVAGLYSLLISIGATTLWGPWDASPPALEIIWIKCIMSHATCASGCHFFAGHCGKLPMLTQTLLNVTGEGKTSKEGNG